MTRPTPFVLTAALAVSLLSFTQVVGHSGAKGAVKTRMDGMDSIQAGMKVLGSMSVGKIDFDNAAAQIAAASIVEHGEQLPAVFEKPEMSDISEANPAIWTNWDDFVAKAEAMTRVAAKTKRSSGTLNALKRNVGKLGDTCKACHQDYRL